MASAGSEDEGLLIRRTQNGDGIAFRILLGRYLPVINKYAVRMLGNHADAADISQEVFIRFWQKASRFDPGKAKLSTWLHKIAHNLCIDHFRKHLSQAGYDDIEAQTIGPETERDQSELGKTIQSSIAQLPERQRSALLFCHYQGLSNKQAAEILEISVDALESLLSRARRSLKKSLEHSHG